MTYKCSGRMAPLTCPAEPHERLNEFFHRLTEMSPFGSFDDAWAGLATELHKVEDELSGIPRNFEEVNEAPPDGRMYPPHMKREVRSDAPGIRSFRQKRHLTSFADNGAIEIVEVRDGAPLLDHPVFEKPGAEGRRVADYRR